MALLLSRRTLTSSLPLRAPLHTATGEVPPRSTLDDYLLFATEVCCCLRF